MINERQDVFQMPYTVRKEGINMKTMIRKPNTFLFVFFGIAVLIFSLVSCKITAFTGGSPGSGDIMIYGKAYSPDTEMISFSGDEIDSVDGLIKNLEELPDLEFVDLGTFPVSMEEAEEIRSELGSIDVKCRICVSMYGEKFSTESTEIDLDGVGLKDVSDLMDSLDRFPNVERVLCTDSEITVDEKNELRRAFPNIDFDIPAFCDLNGERIPDETADIDLRGVAITPKIIEELKTFPMLNSVDMHGSEITPELRNELVSAFPNVRLLWGVDILGEEYESDVTDLDLSGKRGLTPDDVRAFIPLFCGLKRVDLSDCGMDNETLAALRDEFPDTKIVWTLYMGKWSLKTDAVAFSVLIYNYNYTRLRNEDIEVLKYCTDLQALDLGHQALTDISAIAEYLPDLRILILADNSLHDIEPVRKLKHLHYIELFVNPYLNDITPLEDCKELVDVNVSHLYTIHDIHGLLDLPMLERLWIEHTATSQADIQLLRDTYPNAEVVDQGYGSVDQGWRTHPRYFAMIDMYFDTTYMSEEFSKYG